MSETDALRAVTDGSTTEKRSRKPGDLKPCDRCRLQHLKCIYDGDECQRCKKTGRDCLRSRSNIRFRDVSAAKFRPRPKKPSKDLNHDRRLPEAVLSEQSTPPDVVATPPTTSRDKNIEKSANSHSPGSVQEQSFRHPAQYDTSEISHRVNSSGNSRSVTGYQVGVFQSTATKSPQSINGITRVFSVERASTTSSSSYTSPPRLMPRPVPRCLDSLVKSLSTQVSQDTQLYIETVLLRYFHEELAPWFDLCDSDRHFATVIPQKARQPGPLRSALLTISARNLSRNKRFRNASGYIQWNDILMPELNDEFAVPYHNECIRNLLALSTDSKKLYDETLLAAVIALRTDEEMDTNSQGDLEDQQLFLKIASVFIEAQIPPKIALPHSSPEVFHPESSTENIAFHQSPLSNIASPSVTHNGSDDLGANGLRQACFWTAFRQELHAAFLKQQPVRFPLSRCDAFRKLSPAIDQVWSNRMVTFCADVLEFCYGSESSDGRILPAYTSQDRWTELCDYERRLCLLLPSTFEPTYASEPNIARGDIFPEIWYLEPCHVSGTTYVELARMLLEVFNPTRPKLGHGFIAATTAFLSSTKKILFRLCGIAVSNRHCPPSLINACLAISVLGEYFEEPDEQDALLGILDLMSDRHAYPMERIASSLRRAWNRDDPHGVFGPGMSVSHMDTG